MHKNILNITLSVCLLLPSLVRGQDQDRPFSLSDAITIAIQNAPSQQSNRLLVEAARDEAEAERKEAFRPSLTLNLGTTHSGLGASTNPEGLYQSSGVSIGKVIYDGGARKANVNASEMSVKALEAEYNSTNALIPNTSGVLAQNIFEYYFEAASTSASIDINRNRLALLQRVKPFVKDANALSKLNNSLSNYTTRLDSAINRYNDIEADMEHLLYAEMPDQIENVDQTNERMKKDLAPYADVDYAISVAKEKNQNYLAKLYSLRAAEESAKARKAGLTRPTLTTVLANTWSKMDDSTSTLTSRDAYVGVQFNYSLHPGIRNALSASRKRVIAAQQQTEKEIADFVNNIKSNYKKLETSDKNLANLNENIFRLENQIEVFVDKNTVPGSVIDLDNFNFLMELVADMNGNIDMYYNTMYKALSQRYILQREIGILFDTARANFELN